MCVCPLPPTFTCILGLKDIVLTSQYFANNIVTRDQSAIIFGLSACLLNESTKVLTKYILFVLASAKKPVTSPRIRNSWMEFAVLTGNFQKKYSYILITLYKDSNFYYMMQNKNINITNQYNLNNLQEKRDCKFVSKQTLTHI